MFNPTKTGINNTINELLLAKYFIMNKRRYLINKRQMYLFIEINIEFLRIQLEKYYICGLNMCYEL